VQNTPVYAFRMTFRFLQAGSGAAISVSLFLMLILLTIVYFRIYRREQEA
jgi:ABC-type sugar transport system permease subunit